MGRRMRSWWAWGFWRSAMGIWRRFLRRMREDHGWEWWGLGGQVQLIGGIRGVCVSRIEVWGNRRRCLLTRSLGLTSRWQLDGVWPIQSMIRVTGRTFCPKRLGTVAPAWLESRTHYHQQTASLQLPAVTRRRLNWCIAKLFSSGMVG